MKYTHGSQPLVPVSRMSFQDHDEKTGEQTSQALIINRDGIYDVMSIMMLTVALRLIPLFGIIIMLHVQGRAKKQTKETKRVCLSLPPVMTKHGYESAMLLL